MRQKLSLVEMRTMRLTRTGFEIRFTEAMKIEQLAAAKNFQVRRFQYNYNQDDGSLAPMTFVVPGEMVKVYRASARLDEIEEAPVNEKRDLARAMKAEGLTTVEIASKLGVTDRTIRRYLLGESTIP